MKRMIHLPRTAMLLAALYLSTLAAYAQTNAIWNGTAPGDWNAPANWIPPTTVPDGVATFNAPGGKSITFSGAASIGTLQVNGPGYNLSPSFGLSITGSGIQAIPANAPNFPFPVG